MSELLMMRVLLADRVRQMLRVMESLKRRDADWLPSELDGSTCRIIKRLSDELAKGGSLSGVVREARSGYDQDGYLDLTSR
jgi:hypothetical protein